MILTSRDVDSFHFPVLIADIGGTNARFAVLRDAHADLSSAVTVQTRNHPEGLTDVISERVLSRTSLLPRTAVIAIAGPVQGEQTRLTNAPWTIEPARMIEELGLETVVLLNDFEAQALALLTLEPADLQQISGGEVTPYAPKVVIGPGTGLGAGSLIHAADRWVPIPGEGGHAELGPVSHEEYRIWPHLERIGGRIGAEQVVSGAGMVRLARAVAAADGKATTLAAAEDVVNAAEAGDAIATRALELFSAALGRVAGDIALVFLARGGVYLAGGIPPKIASFLKAGAFRRAFEEKAPHQAIMASIPTYIICHDHPALEGLAAFARTPSRFALDLNGRLWRSESACPPAA